jgi:hypothetical protein
VSNNSSKLKINEHTLDRFRVDTFDTQTAIKPTSEAFGGRYSKIQNSFYD